MKKKFLIIGLGNFGSALAKKLSELGHEVFAVDSDLNKVENLKDEVTYAVNINCTDISVLKTLPINEFDYAIVAIGEDFGHSVLVTALLKKLNVKNIISRSISPIHKTILEGLGLPDENIINPEEDSAERLVTKLTMKNISNYLKISQEYSIIEISVPKKYINKKLHETDFRKRYNLNIITVKHVVKNKDDKEDFKVEKFEGVLTGEYVFKDGDIVVVFGHENDIRNWYIHNVENEL
ncbi:MAG: TrkA family potassium uptake protein [Bacteroidales bacterium]|nr:TrkA family potassium uptake protein [Bacteroidales bacterium]